MHFVVDWCRKMGLHPLYHRHYLVHAVSMYKRCAHFPPSVYVSVVLKYISPYLCFHSSPFSSSCPFFSPNSLFLITVFSYFTLGKVIYLKQAAMTLLLIGCPLQIEGLNSRWVGLLCSQRDIALILHQAKRGGWPHYMNLLLDV